MNIRFAKEPSRAVLCLLAALLGIVTAVAQTQVKLTKNKYQPAQDVELGRKAAAEIEKQVKILPDAEVTSYVQRVGQRLVRAIPLNYQHSEFQYDFKVVVDNSINAFALPGGPMYVNTGMITAAGTEGQMAGVMAHEISHVALRHGTAQASKQEKWQYGALAGQIAGAIIGGGAGTLIQQGTGTGIGMYLLKYSREFESEADIVGAQTLARAGYNPNDLANMFRTIEKQGGGRAPQWLSSHPNPDNRYRRIEQEAALLRVARPAADSGDFSRIQTRVRKLAPPKSAYKR